MTTKMLIVYLFFVVPILTIGDGRVISNAYAESSTKERNIKKEVAMNPSDYVQELIKAEEYSDMKDIVESWRLNLDSSVQIEIVAQLFERLIKTDHLPLEQDGSVFILSKVKSGQEDYNHRVEIILQDIYTEGGRCAWAIERMLDLYLPKWNIEDNDGQKEFLRSAITTVVENMAVPDGVEEPKKFIDNIQKAIKTKEVTIPSSISLIKAMAMPEKTKPFQLPINRRIEIAASEETKPVLLERLINDPSIEVRRILVTNPKLPMRALRKMEEDPSPEIREAALSESLKSRTIK